MVTLNDFGGEAPCPQSPYKSDPVQAIFRDLTIVQNSVVPPVTSAAGGKVRINNDFTVTAWGDLTPFHRDLIKHAAQKFLEHSAAVGVSPANSNLEEVLDNVWENCINGKEYKDYASLHLERFSKTLEVFKQGFDRVCEESSIDSTVKQKVENLLYQTIAYFEEDRQRYCASSFSKDQLSEISPPLH